MTNITSISSSGTYFTSGMFDEVSISAGSIRLNGTTQYLQASGVSGLSGNSFTLETWMYLTGYSSNVGIHYPITPAGTSAHGLSLPSLTDLGNGTYTYTYGLGRTFNPGDSVTLWFNYQIYSVINGKPTILSMSPSTSVSASVVSNSNGTLVVSLSNLGNSQAAINKINGQGLNASQYVGDVDVYVALASATSSTPVSIDPYCPIFTSGASGLMLSIPNTSSRYTAINITANGSLVHSFNKSFSLNQWYHIAVTSDNDAGVFTVYVNGYSLGSVSNSVSWTDSSPYVIGYDSVNSFHFGPAYFSNFRIVNGSVIYNNIFTPSVCPLLPVANTALLLTMNPISPLSDTSGNNISVSGVSSPTANNISPFYEPGNIVSSSVGRINDPTIGSSYKLGRSIDPYGNVMPSGIFDEVSISAGSMAFNGSTQYLTASSVGGLSGNAFTIESWMYLTGYSSSPYTPPLAQGGQISFVDPLGNTSPGQIQSVGYSYSAGSYSIVSQASSTSAVLSFPISNCRLNVGDQVLVTVTYSVRDTGTGFQYPVTMLVSLGNPTQSLTSNSITINDDYYTGTCTVTNVTSDTLTVSVNGVALALFTNTANSFTATTGHHFDTNNFTYYVTLVSSSAGSTPTSLSPIFTTGSNGLGIELNGTSSSFTGVNLYANGSIIKSFTSAFSLNQWYHVALSRNSSGVFTLYVNGSSVGSVTNTTTWTDSSPYAIGYDSSSSIYFGPGYLSNFRIVNGSVVYGSNFTPSQGPLLPVTNTALLLVSNPMNPFTDTSGNNVNVSLVANPTFSTVSPFYASGKTGVSSVGTVSNPALGSAVQIAQSMDLKGNLMTGNGIDEVTL